MVVGFDVEVLEIRVQGDVLVEPVRRFVEVVESTRLVAAGAGGRLGVMKRVDEMWGKGAVLVVLVGARPAAG